MWPRACNKTKVLQILACNKTKVLQILACNKTKVLQILAIIIFTSEMGCDFYRLSIFRFRVYFFDGFVLHWDLGLVAGR